MSELFLKLVLELGLVAVSNTCMFLPSSRSFMRSFDFLCMFCDLVQLYSIM